ncbi:MAG TPA: Ppx/GppA family phosphatase [Stellaceae bacterium]|nr:Ppx/GppA family phosphatase [Stellaceae bacterium]
MKLSVNHPHRHMVGIIDIGSNSLRLVIYDGISRAPVVLFNEKAMCALGRGLNATGRLNAEGVVLAMGNLERFVALARSVGVGRLDVLATSAVRDAQDGPHFVAEVERRCGITVRVIDGEEEGRLAAAGVHANIPEAYGMVGDLGGGSAELAMISAENGPSGIGKVASLPIGPLRLIESPTDEEGPRRVIDRQVATLPWLAEGRGLPFYAVGGAWRTLARIHMEQTGYPLHVIQNYELTAGEAISFLEIVGRLSRRSLEKMVGISRKRLETVPLAAYALTRLLRVTGANSVIFSASGLREGHLYDLLSAEDQALDPLLFAAASIAQVNTRFGASGDTLFDWTAPLFVGETASQRRLRHAAALLSDIGWNEHPDYRQDQAFMRCLRMPVAGIDHAGRVFLATALHARYGGAPDAVVVAPVRKLLAPEAEARARAVGLALRLGYTLTGGVAQMIGETRLLLDPTTVTLEVPAGGSLYAGEAVQRRLDALGRALNRRTAILALPRDAA